VGSHLTFASALIARHAPRHLHPVTAADRLRLPAVSAASGWRPEVDGVGTTMDRYLAEVQN
jgi:hypothetical protein